MTNQLKAVESALEVIRATHVELRAAAIAREAELREEAQEIFTTKEAADYLRLKPKTLMIWRQKGKGPAFHKLGDGSAAHVRYRRADLDNWIITGATTSN